MARGKKVRLSEKEREKVKAVIERDKDPVKTAQRWGMNDTPLMRAKDGYPIQRGTKALIELGLQKEAEG